MTSDHKVGIITTLGFKSMIKKSHDGPFCITVPYVRRSCRAPSQYKDRLLLDRLIFIMGIPLPVFSLRRPFKSLNFVTQKRNTAKHSYFLGRAPEQPLNMIFFSDEIRYFCRNPNAVINQLGCHWWHGVDNSRVSGLPQTQSVLFNSQPRFGSREWFRSLIEL